MRSYLLLLFCLFLCTGVHAQETFPAPVTDLVPKRTNLQRPPLAQQPIREADIVWQKRVWREIDVREKINLAFAYPQRPLATILMEAVQSGELRAYSTIDDRFTTPLTRADLDALLGSSDTVAVVDPETQLVSYEVVPRTFNPATVVRYRVQEIWFVDRNTSTMQSRIIGLAPIVDEQDEASDFSYAAPLFWINYPEARPILGRERAWVTDNETAAVTWDDVFTMRRFDSKVTKEGNVYDRRIEDASPDGRERLLIAQRKERERLARESDLWEW